MIDEMSLFEFTAAVGGFTKANTPEADQPLSEADIETLSAWVDEPPIWH